MIVRDVECWEHGKHEVFLERDEVPTCPVCGGNVRILISAPHVVLDGADRYPLNGVYDRGLGERVFSDRDRIRKARKKGLVPLSEIDPVTYERGLAHADS